MKLYSREVTMRMPVNKFGRLGFVLVREYVATDNIDPYNKRRHIKFKECEGDPEGFLPDRITPVEIKKISRTR